MTLHAHAERLDALQQLEGIHRRHTGAEIAQPFGARAHDEGGGAELLVEDDAVIAGIGLGQQGEFAGCAPVETAAVDDRAADRNAMAADPFGGRMHHDVGAELDGLAEVRRGKGVVDQQRNFRRMCDLGNLGDVEHFEAGIADGFTDHEPRVWPDRGAESLEVARLHERRRDAEARQRVRQQIDGAAIERGGGHDVVAGIEQGCDGQMHCGHAARRRDRADAVFQRRQPLLQYRDRRIGDAGIDVAGAFEVEQCGGVVGILEHVRRGLVDRDRARSRHGIGMLSRMEGQGFKAGRLRCGHVGLWRCGGARCATLGKGASAPSNGIARHN